MGKCIKCGDKVYRSDYLYCKDCYSKINYFCDICNLGLFKNDDMYRIIISEDDFYLCCKNCYSQFLKFNNLSKKINDFQKIDVNMLNNNDYIIHKKYGLGKIVKMDNIIISIDFFDKNRIFDKAHLNTLCDIIYKIDETIFDNNFISRKIVKDVSNDKQKITKEKYGYSYFSDDGHPARSRGEQLIDNYLFNHNIRHVYERNIVSPISGNSCTCDWYLPDYDVYIEFWGVENSKRYEDTKEYKIKIYNECGYNLFELTPDDVDLRLDYSFQKFMYKYKKND